jgi:hypothetical protein
MVIWVNDPKKYWATKEPRNDGQRVNMHIMMHIHEKASCLEQYQEILPGVVNEAYPCTMGSYIPRLDVSQHSTSQR